VSGAITCDLARLAEDAAEDERETLPPSVGPLWAAAERGDYDALIHEVES